MQIPLRRLDPDLPLPAAQHPGDAGYDLHARQDVALRAGGGRALVPTGVAIAIPEGCAGFIQPRSGLALRHGVTCLNTPGLIDAGYRGELRVILINLGGEPVEIGVGDRIAQLVVVPVALGAAVEVTDLPESDGRGEGGFGSTGR